MLEFRTHKGYSVWGKGPAIRIAAAATAIAVAALFFRASLLPMVLLDAVRIAEYVFILCTAIALTALYAGFAERLRLHRVFKIPGLILISAALLFCGVYKLGMHQFGAWDEDLLVHAGTYYAQGFKPYIGFDCTMPPFFMACVRCGVKLLGLQWSSFTLIAATFSALTSLWIFALLRRCAIPSHWALAITIGAEMSTMLVIPFWWYNNSSSVAVVLLCLSVLACLYPQKSLLPWVSLSLSLAMVITSKPNIATACLMPLVLLATKDKVQWAKIVAASAGALGIARLICFVAQMPPIAVLHSYAEVAKLRGTPFLLLREMRWPEQQFQIFFIVVSAICFAAPLAIALKRRSIPWPLLAVCTIAALTSFAMAVTNSEMKSSDLSPLLVAAAVLWLQPWEKMQPGAGRKTVLVGLLSLFMVMSSFYGVIHLRILNIGPGMYYEPLQTQTIQSGFFAGLEAGPRLQRVLAQTSEVLSMYPSQRVFFGPRMEFAYAAFKKPLAPGMPLVWDAGNLFAAKRLPQFLLTFQQRDPDLLIFLKDDYTRMGLVATYIETAETYRHTDQFNELTVYVRNRSIPVTYITEPASDPTSKR